MDAVEEMMCVVFVSVTKGTSSRTTANVIEKEVMTFNMKSNEIITDFKLLPCYIKSKLFTTFCTDASYGILNQEKCTIFMSLGEK